MIRTLRIDAFISNLAFGSVEVGVFKCGDPSRSAGDAIFIGGAPSGSAWDAIFIRGDASGSAGN